MDEVIRGATRSSTSCIVFGPLDALHSAVASHGSAALELQDAPTEIGNDSEPAKAIRAKPDASIVQAADAVAQGRADALVSAGSTGAVLAASLLRIKRIPGVYRPAVAVQVPVPGRRLLLLDVGANSEIRTEQLVQFAFMGSAFCEGVLGVPRPEVGLLSIGSEPEKGTAEVIAAHEQLREASLNFIGNVEGNDLTAGRADVIVTDGFTGNVALKAIEGTLGTLTRTIRDRIASGTVSKLGGLLIRSRLRSLRDELDPEAVGGAFLLGLRSPVVICHGNSSAHAIASAISLAEEGVREDVVGKTAAALTRAGVARQSRGRDDRHDEIAPSVTADSVESR